jgi:hypothetical protein
MLVIKNPFAQEICMEKGQFTVGERARSEDILRYECDRLRRENELLKEQLRRHSAGAMQIRCVERQLRQLARTQQVLLLPFQHAGN